MNFEGSLQSRREGASADAVAALLSWAATGLPNAYLDFLRYSNGLEDWDSYSVVLWPAQDVPDANRDYEVAEYAPGLLLIGSNGGGEAVALDTRPPDSPDHWAVVAVPFIGMALDVCIQLAPSFSRWAAARFPFSLDGSPATES